MGTVVGDERPASEQLVGEVMAHQDDDQNPHPERGEEQDNGR